MISTITTARAEEVEGLLFDSWFDPIEDGLRAKVRGFIETMIEEELTTALSRPRYGRGERAGAGVVGHRHGRRRRRLTGTFGPTEMVVPRARLVDSDGTRSEWRSAALRAYQRRTLAADALIASTYLAGTNTRRVRRALAAVFAGGVGKDVVSRVWRKVKTDWDVWNARSLQDEPMVRLILDGTVVRVRLDRKATSISLLVVIGVRVDGQKVLLAIKSMGGETTEAWRTVLDDLVARGLRRPQFLIVDGAPGLDKALAAAGMACRHKDARFTSIATSSQHQFQKLGLDFLLDAGCDQQLRGAYLRHDRLQPCIVSRPELPAFCPAYELLLAHCLRL
jgi:putative transposase